MSNEIYFTRNTRRAGRIGDTMVVVTEGARITITLQPNGQPAKVTVAKRALASAGLIVPATPAKVTPATKPATARRTPTTKPATARRTPATPAKVTPAKVTPAKVSPATPAKVTPATKRQSNVARRKEVLTRMRAQARATR